MAGENRPVTGMAGYSDYNGYCAGEYGSRTPSSDVHEPGRGDLGYLLRH
jgi:hypothetical protein